MQFKHTVEEIQCVIAIEATDSQAWVMSVCLSASYIESNHYMINYYQ